MRNPFLYNFINPYYYLTFWLQLSCIILMEDYVFSVDSFQMLHGLFHSTLLYSVHFSLAFAKKNDYSGNCQIMIFYLPFLVPFLKVLESSQSNWSPRSHDPGEQVGPEKTAWRALLPLCSTMKFLLWKWWLRGWGTEQKGQDRRCWNRAKCIFRHLRAATEEQG